ncbi:hypothetical protein BRE01_25300 [Brevibacillus reuszeri]|uniref:SpoVT-AbrB domain-containing protein n=1 Tax=Brevibacillus reuszeri TaxID=54915 RepID=A0A0K9YME0_9BACL|nr:hypothetical protein ADS79_28725 [Brevibacillus reuszeri]GED68828.1 hypothetical protein BRE01_25300 [Brevibacillus reuszeri]
MDDIIIKTAPLTSKGQITIPQKVRELLEVSTRSYLLSLSCKSIIFRAQLFGKIQVILHLHSRSL